MVQGGYTGTALIVASWMTAFRVFGVLNVRLGHAGAARKDDDCLAPPTFNGSSCRRLSSGHAESFSTAFF